MEGVHTDICLPVRGNKPGKFTAAIFAKATEIKKIRRIGVTSREICE
jgi:hypothetical protein